MKKITLAALCASLSVSACASSPDDISSQFISPTIYSGYTCDQIRGDLMRIGDRVAVLSGQQRRRASQDGMVVAGALLVPFAWPALFFLSRGDKADELARLKGEYEALNSAATTKQCATQAG